MLSLLLGDKDEPPTHIYTMGGCRGGHCCLEVVVVTHICQREEDGGGSHKCEVVDVDIDQILINKVST